MPIKIRRKTQTLVEIHWKTPMLAKTSPKNTDIGGDMILG
jgi:hypothetical protein